MGASRIVDEESTRLARDCSIKGKGRTKDGAAWEKWRRLRHRDGNYCAVHQLACTCIDSCDGEGIRARRRGGRSRATTTTTATGSRSVGAANRGESGDREHHSKQRTPATTAWHCK